MLINMLVTSVCIMYRIKLRRIERKLKMIFLSFCLQHQERVLYLRWIMDLVTCLSANTVDFLKDWEIETMSTVMRLCSQQVASFHMFRRYRRIPLGSSWTSMINFLYIFSPLHRTIICISCALVFPWRKKVLVNFTLNLTTSMLLSKFTS